MSDSEPKKRRFWQVHLSTAVAMMFALGGFLQLNIVGKLDFSSDGVLAYTEGRIYGFPFSDYTAEFTTPTYDADRMEAIPEEIQRRQLTFDEWRISGCILNVAFCFFSIAAIALVCEWLIRRRKANKP